MSRPGDAGREQVLWQGGDPGELMAAAVDDLKRRIPNLETFELAYTAADRDLADGEEPREDEAVAWTVTVVIRRPRAHPRSQHPTRTVVGRHTVQPGDVQAMGAVLAMVDLLEQLGANVVLVS